LYIVPHTKEIDLITNYRYLPFPRPISILPKAHDLIIAQSLSSQYFSKSSLDQLFNQNDLDYLQEAEALFISDNLNLIAVSANDKF
jgi:hypothetical protein